MLVAGSVGCNGACLFQGREQELKDKVAQLQRQVEELRTQVSEKDKAIRTLTSDMDSMVRLPPLSVFLSFCVPP